MVQYLWSALNGVYQLHTHTFLVVEGEEEIEGEEGAWCNIKAQSSVLRYVISLFDIAEK